LSQNKVGATGAGYRQNLTDYEPMPLLPV
jgi:hypothetical protein